jgi:ATP/maltotriose-dependent transcriptional regulator MalT
MHFFEGRFAEAVECGERALTTASTLGPDGQDIKMGITWALEAAVASGDRAAVERVAGWVEALPPGLRAPVLVGHAHRARARVAGTLEEARADHQAAVGVFRRLGLPFWLAVSLCEFAEALVRDGRGVEAEPMLAEARGVFEPLGVPGWVERVSRAEAGETAGAVG